jgi:hypothetical protein
MGSKNAGVDVFALGFVVSLSLPKDDGDVLRYTGGLSKPFILKTIQEISVVEKERL